MCMSTFDRCLFQHVLAFLFVADINVYVGWFCFIFMYVFFSSLYVCLCVYVFHDSVKTRLESFHLVFKVVLIKSAERTQQ